MELQPRYYLLLYRCRSACEKLVGFISYLEMENNVFWQINKVIIQYTCILILIMGITIMSFQFQVAIENTLNDSPTCRLGAKLLLLFM